MGLVRQIGRAAFALALGLGMGSASPRPAAAQEDPFAARMQSGQRLFQEEKYREALPEFQQAYALRQSPAVLLALAQTNQRLGNAEAALDAYERYLIAVPVGAAERGDKAFGDAEREAELLRRHVQALRAGRAPSPGITPEVLRALLAESRKETDADRTRSRNRGLMAGGAVLFGAGYFGALMTGSFLVTETDTCGTSSSRVALGPAAGTLFVPFLGPVISGLMCREVTWSVPWILVDGAAQIGGLAMMIAASRSNLRLKTQRVSMQLLPYSSSTSHGFALSGRF